MYTKHTKTGLAGSHDCARLDMGLLTDSCGLLSDDDKCGCSESNLVRLEIDGRGGKEGGENCGCSDKVGVSCAVFDLRKILLEMSRRDGPRGPCEGRPTSATTWVRCQHAIIYFQLYNIDYLLMPV